MSDFLTKEEMSMPDVHRAIEAMKKLNFRTQTGVYAHVAQPHKIAKT